MISPIPSQADYGDGDTREADADGVIVETGPDTRPADVVASDERREKVATLIALAQERFRTVSEAESKLRTDMREDRRFRLGEQWPDHIRSMREASGKPCITINRIPQFLRQVVNSARANKPAIQVNPVDSGADPDTALILQGLARHIEIQSHASIAYETASEHQAEMGRGYFRLVTEYDDDEGFQQRIVIKRVRNPFTIYMDQGQDVTGADAEFAFVVQDLTHREFKRKYPKANYAGLSTFQGTGDQPLLWISDKSVRVAEYWYVEYEPFEIAQIEMAAYKDPETGQVGPKILVVPRAVLLDSRRKYRDEMQMAPTEDADEIEATDIPGVKILQKRTVQRRRVKTCVINAVEVLEGNADKTGGTDWHGKRIPIIPVIGDEVELDGRIDLRGMVRDGRDPQRMYNYWNSSATETIGLAPRAPWIGVEGQFKGHETKWGTANTQNHGYLEYKNVSLGGKPAPPPKRSVEEPAIQAIMIALRQADLDLKAVMGLFDPSLGQATSADESGKAILARQRQGEVANSNYADNLARAIQACGEIIIDVAPKIYDVATVVRIMGDDDETKPVMLHAGKPPVLPQGVPNLKELAKLRKLQGIYDISVGRYDVTVSVGPVASQRQEAVDAMVQVLTRSPELMPVIGDLVFKNMDWPGAKAIAKRLKRAVPPHLADPEEGEEEVPAAARQEIAQLKQQAQEMQQAIQQMQMERAAKAQELAAKGQVAQFEAEARARTASETAAAQVRIAEIEARSAAAKVELQAMADRQLAVLKSQLDAMLIQLEAKLDEKIELIKAKAQAAERAEPAA